MERILPESQLSEIQDNGTWRYHMHGRKTIEEMEHTLAFRREAKKLNVAESMLAMADLMSVGYKDIDAFKICYPENMQYPEKQQKSIMENIVASAKFKKLLDSRKSRVKESAIPVNLDEVILIGDEEVAREILRSAMSTPVGSKERADLLLKYNEILHQSDIEDNDDGTDSISFYLPLKCSMCQLYKEFDRLAQERGIGKISSIEMNDIIRQGVAIAYPNAIEAYERLHGISYAHVIHSESADYERELKALNRRYGKE